GALVGVGCVEAAAGGLRHFFAIRNYARGEAWVRDGLFRRALELDARFHDRTGAGDLMSRASNDAQLIGRVLDSAGHSAGYVLTIVAASVLMLTIDPVLALVVLVPLPFVAFGFWRYSSRYAEKTRLLQEELAVSTALVEETVAGIRVVKGLGAGGALSARFRRVSDRIVGRALDVAGVDAVFLPGLEILPLLGILGVLWLGSRRVVAGDLTIGGLVAFNAYVALLVWPLRTLGQRVGTWQRGAAAAARVDETLRSRPAVVERKGARRLAAGPAAVRFEAVRFGYDPERPVLDGLDLEIPAGTSLALVGATGSGKSTAAALLARFYDVDAGRIAIGGDDVRDLRVGDLRRAVALVFDDTFLFSATVRDNVGFARAEATDEEIEAAARAGGAHEFVAALPQGYATVLGERGFSLSGGQRQRIAIARAVLADPAVLVLDDATSAVDATKEHEIRAALASAMAGRTTLVIAHRPATIALADAVAVLEDGRIVETGAHADLLMRSQRYRRLLALDGAEVAAA
ncbi:MAG TPA: ABC transporter ATP-binding protein, partial [Gaiellaceae bacterium]|nr:ABC transporter ATP-binding protein [Gaiellaceae bacterium]